MSDRQTIADVELKSCPFCGQDPVLICITEGAGKDQFEREHGVRCDPCAIAVFEEYRDDAIERWNTRSDRLEALSGGEAVALAAISGIADDYMTSEKHHPGYVLIPQAKFDQLRAAELVAPRPMPEDATPAMVKAALAVDWNNEDEEGTAHNIWHAMCAAAPQGLRPMPGREEVAKIIHDRRFDPWTVDSANEMADAILSIFSASLGGREDTAARVTDSGRGALPTPPEGAR